MNTKNKQRMVIVFILFLFGNTAIIELAYSQSLNFIDSGQRLGERYTFDVALGDLDGDTDLDAFVVNAGGEANTVWLNQGGAQNGTPGLFADSGQALGNEASQTVALGDLDNDGDLDAFVGNVGTNEIWRNDGSGQFSNSGQALGSYVTWAVALGDVDGDGDLDAVTANVSFEQPSKLWLNQGGLQNGTVGTFSDSNQTLNQWSGAVALGDLDGDADLDIYLGSSDGLGQDQIWFNNGSGQFSNSGQTLGNFDTRAVALGDLDGDGDLDAIATNISTTRRYKIWLNRGDGHFTDNGQTELQASGYKIALADLDGDADLDAFVPVLGGGGNLIWLNDGQGRLVESGLALGNGDSYSVALGDLDNDGDVDAFVGNFGHTGAAAANTIWLNQTNLDQPEETSTVFLPVVVRADTPTGGEKLLFSYACICGSPTDIFTINPNASERINLTNHTNQDSTFPVWSPDKTRIAFISNRDRIDGNNDLYLMNADGSGLLRLTNSAAVKGKPTWSPDGSRLAFTHAFGINNVATGLYVIQTDGSGLNQITTPSAGDVTASDWSPDGGKLLFASTRHSPVGGPLNQSIYVMSVDGSNPQMLTDATGYDYAPRWSPDGSQIAFTSNRKPISGQPAYDNIFVMNADGSNMVKLTLTGPFQFNHSPAWSPNGSQIAYLSNRISGAFTTNPEIFIMNADGSNQQRLTTSDLSESFVDW